ncbi:MAG: hypothetical protein J5943_03090 [Oribacterium sp.]|nr:hypothetical protein [Oribacterium sp.]
MRRKIIALLAGFVMALSMGTLVFAAEPSEEQYVEIEVPVESIAAVSPSTHNIGMLNLFYPIGTYEATSAIGSFNISSTSIPSGATISKIVVTSSKSSGSTGTITVYMAKDEDNGDGTFDRYTDSKTWASSLTYWDFGNYNLDPAGDYYVYFTGRRYSATSIAAATLTSVTVKVYYN